MQRPRLPALLLSAAAFLVAGCVRREVAITSEPAGAEVIINGEPVGRTPVERLRFTHYGTWRVELRLPGYEPLIEAVRVGPPLYERMGPDLVAGLVPVEIHDRRTLHYRLRKAEKLAREEILRRARAAVEEAGLPPPPEPEPRTEEEWQPSRPLPPEAGERP